MLSGKVALVTGSAKGLGKKAALTLAEMGCDVVVNYLHSRDEALELMHSIEQKGVRARLVQADISKKEDLLRMTEEIALWRGGIDIMVNNAGPYIRERRLFSEYAADEIEYLLDGNLYGVMLLDHIAIPWMRRQNWGRIIHFGFSRAAEARGWPHRSVYAAAKVGLVSFTKTLAVEEARHGITVNMICPGDIKGAYKEKDIAEVGHLTDEQSPRGRPGTGEDVARVIRFLCDPNSDFITGNIIDVSGGLDPIRAFPMTEK